MFPLLDLRQNTGFFTLLLETLQGTLKRFVLFDAYSRHKPSKNSPAPRETARFPSFMKNFFLQNEQFSSLLLSICVCQNNLLRSFKYCTIQKKWTDKSGDTAKKLYNPAFSLLASLPMLEVALSVPHIPFSGAATLKINPLMEASMAKAAKATLTKSELIDTLHAKNGTLTKKAVSEVVDQVFSTITDHVAKGTAVNIVGFGKFHAVKRAARTGRNPATGAVIKIAATTTPRFAAGKAFKDSVARKK